MKKSILVLGLYGLIGSVFADVNDDMEIYIVKTNKPIKRIVVNKPSTAAKTQKMSISNNIYDKCFDLAGVEYNVPPNLLRVIAQVESRYNPYAINYNNNGSYDMGLMQINSSWLPTLAKKGIKKDDLWNGCKSIQVGAWILSSNIKKYGLTLEAIGRYNSPNAYYKNKYTQMIVQTYKQNRAQLIALN